MKRTLALLAITIATATPMFAQATPEVGFIVGGSHRFVENDRQQTTDVDDSFSFSNTSFELYYATPLDEITNIKFKVGRIENSVGFIDPANDAQRIDVKGEIQHIDVVADYRASEPFGTAGLFAGLGLYRQTASGFDADTGWGLQAGINADFPLSRRYGIVTEASYHWTRLDTKPRYLTIGAGLRIALH